MTHTCELPPIMHDIIAEPRWHKRRWNCACGLQWVAMKELWCADGVWQKTAAWVQLPEGDERKAMHTVIRNWSARRVIDTLVVISPEDRLWLRLTRRGNVG